MNNNDILGVSTLSTVNVNVANLVVSSINGLTPGGGGGSIPANLGVSSITTSTITFDTLGGIYGNVNVLNTSNVPVFSFDTVGRTLATSNTSGDITIISPTSISVSDGLIQSEITPGMITAEQLTLVNPNSNITAQVLYYNTGTSEVSYGDAGVATVPANLSISSLQAVSTVAVSSFTSSMTSFFTSTNQLRANDLTVQQGVLAGMTIAGNNITANGIAPAGGIVSGRIVQTQSSITTTGSISSLTVSTINGVIPTFGGSSTTGVILALGSTTGLGTNTLTNLGWTTPFIQNTIPGFTYSTSGGTANYFINNTASSITVNVSANIRMLVAANTTGGMRLNIINRSDVNPIFQDVLAWDYQTVPSLTTAREHSFQVEAVFICGAGQRWAIQVQTDINSGAGTPALQASRLNVLTVN
jgi:hypothetical protein